MAMKRPSMQGLASAGRQTLEWADEVGRVWLGWTLPPPRIALAETDWRPDSREVYCPRCGGSIGEGEATAKGCGACRGRAVAGQGTVRLGRYERPLRDWILQIKFGSWAPMGDALGAMLGAAASEAGMLNPEKVVVVPMPMPWQRRLYRGIDHASVIAAAVAKRLHAPCLSVLAKENGPPQTTLKAGQRRAGWGQRMWIRRRWGGWGLEGRHILLVDDVRTTGESLRRAAGLIRQLGPERIVVGVLAVADPSGRGRRTVPAADTGR